MQTQEQPARTGLSIELNPGMTSWQVAPELDIPGYAFNGQVPGPVIEASVGDTVTIVLNNRLPEPTAIHWHGLRVPAAMDGTEMVQRPVEPGNSFQYRFVVPDAGTFWYHPHRNETEQLEKGLYGAFIVRNPADPVFDDEKVLVLDDLKLDRNDRLAPFGSRRDRHDGRRGDVLLTNGTADAVLTMAARQVERWRIVNASSSRYVRLSLGGRRLLIVATDGGLIHGPPHPTDEVLLAPAERVDLAVGPFFEGGVIPVEGLAYKRGMITDKGGRYASLHIGAAEPSKARIPATLRTIEPLAPADAPVTRTVRLQARMSLRRGVDWHVDGHAHHLADAVRVGDLQVWDVVNETRMDHPFHLHGFFFQVLQADGTPPPFRAWKDTVNIPAKGRVRLAWLPDDRPGSWMYHCHILEHHAAGMMAHFDVVGDGLGG